MTCAGFAALYLTLGLGALDENRWIDVNGGHQIGKAALTQELISCERVGIQLSAEHWSSIHNGDDRGVNALLLEATIKIY